MRARRTQVTNEVYTYTSGRATVATGVWQPKRRVLVTVAARAGYESCEFVAFLARNGEDHTQTDAPPD